MWTLPIRFWRWFHSTAALSGPNRNAHSISIHLHFRSALSLAFEAKLRAKNKIELMVHEDKSRAGGEQRLVLIQTALGRKDKARQNEQIHKKKGF